MSVSGAAKAAMLFAVVLTLAGPGVAVHAEGARASALPSVTLRVVNATVNSGEPVIVTGRTPNSRPGSVVQLQKRNAAGAWVIMRRQQTTQVRTFRFSTRPSLGTHRYRVVKPRQFGQPRAVSPGVSARVVPLPPKPTLTVTSSTRIEEDMSMLILTGTVGHLPGAVVTLESRFGSSQPWYPLDSPRSTGDEPVSPGADGTFSFRTNDRLIRQFRVVAVAGSTKLVSQTFANARATYNLEINEGVTLNGLFAEQASGRIRIDLTAGMRVSLNAESYDDPVNVVTAPDGSSIGTFQGLLRFTVPSTGSYLITISPDSDLMPVTLWATTPKTIPMTVGSNKHLAADLLPGQVPRIEVPLLAGQTVWFSNGTTTQPSATLYTPDGVAVPPIVDAHITRFHRATMAGTYAFLYENITAAFWDLAIHDIPTYQDVLNAGEVNIATPATDPQWALAEFDLVAGQRVTVVTTGPNNHDLLTGPDGQQIGIGSRVFTATQTGIHREVVRVLPADGPRSIEIADPLEVPSTIGVPVEVDNTGHQWRIFQIAVPAKAGDILYVPDDDSYMVLADGSDAGIFLGGYSNGFRVPTDQTVFFQVGVEAGETIARSVERAEQVSVTVDGQPTQIDLDGDSLKYALVSSAPGVFLDMEGATTNPNFVDWFAQTLGPVAPNMVHNCYVAGDIRSTCRYVTPPAGEHYISFSTGGDTGQLTFAVSTVAP